MALGPAWFSGVDAIFAALFCTLTFIITGLGLRAYRFFGEERYLWHALGFGFLTASYAVLALTNLFTYLQEDSRLVTLNKALEVARVINIGTFLHAILFLCGVVALVILYLRINDWNVRMLLFCLVAFAIALAGHASNSFRVLLAVLLLFILVEMGMSYQKNPQVLAVWIGLMCVLIGEAVLGVLFLNPLLYVISNIVTLVGYLLMLGSRLVRR